MNLNVEMKVDTAVFNKILELINQMGVAKVSVAKICRELQLSRGWLLSNYGNKDQLLKIVLTQLIVAEAEFLQANIKPMTTSHKQLEAFIQASFEYGYQQQDRKAALMELGNGYKLIMHTADQSGQLLQRIISEGVANNEFTNIHVELACQFIQGVIDREISRQSYFWEEPSSRMIFYLSVMKMVDKLLL